jgi:putative flippase GtrA
MVQERCRKISKQFTKYFGVALIGYVIDFGTLIALTEILHVHYLIAATSGFILGLIVVYILSGKYVFGASKIKSRLIEFLLFAVIGLVGLGLLNLLMWVMTGLFGIYYIVSKIFATIVVYIWNFLARRSLYEDRRVG